MKIVQADARTGLAIGPWSFLMSHALLIGIQIPHSKRVLNDAFNRICNMHTFYVDFSSIRLEVHSVSMDEWPVLRHCHGFMSLISTAMLRTSDQLCIFLVWCAVTNRKQYVCFLYLWPKASHCHMLRWLWCNDRKGSVLCLVCQATPSQCEDDMDSWMNVDLQVDRSQGLQPCTSVESSAMRSERLKKEKKKNCK